MIKKRKGSITRIGFDFDKVFVNYPPLVPEWLINKLYKKVNHNLSYRMPGSIEKKIRILSHHPVLRHSIITNIKALDKISKAKNIETYLISSRFGFLKNRTEKWLLQHKIKSYFKETHFNFKNVQPHFFKSKMIEDLRIEIYVDDDLDLLKYLLKKNPSLKLYWVTKNRKVDLPKNIHAITTLDELNDIK